MTSYERLAAVLTGKTPDKVPVTPHWWGLYRFQFAGLISGYEEEYKAWNTPASELFEIDRQFYREFRPDMLHLTTAPAKAPPSNKEQEELLTLRREAAELHSYTAVDRYISAISQSKEAVSESGVFDHVRLHREKYGSRVLIALNEGADIACYLDTHVGFEQGLMGLLENPDLTGYYLSRLYENTLQRLRALKACGADAYINSETYCSPDILSPTLYREIILPVQQRFYREVHKIGLLPIAYFTGNIEPILEDIKTLDICGMMVEESKKGFVLEPGSLVRKIEKQFALFGNLDSYYTLQAGTPEQIKRETEAMLQATEGYPFVMANGCPISFHTPPQNIHAMIDAARAH